MKNANKEYELHNTLKADHRKCCENILSFLDEDETDGFRGQTIDVGHIDEHYLYQGGYVRAYGAKNNQIVSYLDNNLITASIHTPLGAFTPFASVTIPPGRGNHKVFVPSSGCVKSSGRTRRRSSVARSLQLVEEAYQFTVDFFGEDRVVRVYSGVWENYIPDEGWREYVNQEAEKIRKKHVEAVRRAVEEARQKEMESSPLYTEFDPEAGF